MTHRLEAPVEQVWAAYTDPSLRAAVPSQGRGADHRHDLDAVAGGHERLAGTSGPTGERLAHEARFHVVAEPRLLVSSYELRVDDALRTVALMTIALMTIMLALSPHAQTDLERTERFVLLGHDGDGTLDEQHLRGGTRLALGALQAVLDRLG